MIQTVETSILPTIPSDVFTMVIEDIPDNKKKQKLINLDNKEGCRRIHIKAHKNGLTIELVPRFLYVYSARDNQQIIPGQYTIEQFVDYTIERSLISNLKNQEYIEIAKANLISQLKESGIWDSRGKVFWKDVPEDFWKCVSISDFVIGTVKSFDAWWLSALLKFKNGRSQIRNKYKWENKTDVERSIKAAEVPENVNRIRHWNKLSFSELMDFVGLGYTTSTSWNAFITNVKPVFYKSFMEKHNDWTESDAFTSAVEYLNKLPKNEKIINALNSLSNSGLSVKDILELDVTTVKDMEKAANYSLAYQTIARKNKKHLNSNYHPPIFETLLDEKGKELPGQFKWDNDYEWATHLTFPALSDLYSCCISRYGSYEERIVNGVAHTFFAKDHTKENDMGVLAYISYKGSNTSYDGDVSMMDNLGKWQVSEIRAYANQEPSAKHKAYAERVVTALNKSLPGKHAVVTQMEREQLMSEMATDEIGSKVRDIWSRK